MNRQNLITSLEEEMHRLSQGFGRSSRSSSLKTLAQNLVEGLDTIYLNTMEALQSQNAVSLSLLQSMTGDRGKMMESIRNSYLESEKGLNQNEKSDLLYMTNLFERCVWMMGRLGKMVETGAQYSSLKT